MIMIIITYEIMLIVNEMISTFFKLFFILIIKK